MQTIGLCWHCRKPLSKADYARENCCLGCNKPTRVCRNCAHYAPGRPNDCLEPMAEPMLSKDRATMCEFFEVHPNPAGSGRTDPDDLRSAADALFK